MKTLGVMSLLLSLALLAGIGFLVLEVADIGNRLNEIEESRAENTAEIRNEISAAFTRIGELDRQVTNLSERMENQTVKGLDASVESLIETKLADRETKKREQDARRARDRQERREEREFDRLVRDLQLNDENKEKMNGVMDKMRQARTAFFEKLRDDGDWNRDRIREGMAKINTKTDEAVKKILLEDQFKKYEKVQKENRQRWERFGGGHRH